MIKLGLVFSFEIKAGADASVRFAEITPRAPREHKQQRTVCLIRFPTSMTVMMFATRRLASRLRCPSWQVSSHLHHGRPLSSTAPRNYQPPNAVDNPFEEQPREDDPLLEKDVPLDSFRKGGMKYHGEGVLDRTKVRRATSPKGVPESLMQDYTLPVFSLRDMCTCHLCVDHSTRQKLFSTVDIPLDISIKSVTELSDGIQVEWRNDMPTISGQSHVSFFKKETIDAMARTGSSKALPSLPHRRLWNDAQFRSEAPDISYEAYMQDDATLYQALQQLYSHGLLFLKDVPESAESVSRITQRIGPLKSTFYGETWDVRSVPQAKNVAYTSQDLGFHMDLLYMKQPPHLQFLHCIRSSASGGASLFSDSFKAVSDLYHNDRVAFGELECRPITFHYDHIDSHYYQQSRPLIELAPLKFGAKGFDDYKLLEHYKGRAGESSWLSGRFNLNDYLEAVSWSPPFQAPFQLTNSHSRWPGHQFAGDMEVYIRKWREAAGKFNDIIHREENVHERMMGPGECVIFDNRRVLHARKAFEVADAGKERWLRGSYLDKDPFISKLRVLAHRFANEGLAEGTEMNEEKDVRAEAAAAAA